MTTKARRILVVGALLLAATAASGCGKSDNPTLGSVSGTVSLDGTPLANALVLFTPAGEGRTSRATTNSDGRYILNYLRDIGGANLGPHVVRITTASAENGKKESLPPRYHAKSTLSASVAPGDNTIDLQLESKPR
ncbi:MAG: carboxypeptidase-like regulatory domain-containing protein [Pirellulales bacterium]